MNYHNGLLARALSYFGLCAPLTSQASSHCTIMTPPQRISAPPAKKAKRKMERRSRAINRRKG